jgi:hypothetical protein
MKYLWRSGKQERQQIAPGGPGDYESVITVRSRTLPGVTFAIKRISFGRRMELSRRARELSKKAEFLEAGSELRDKIEAGILAQEVDAMYLSWGLVSIAGLTIDGEPATAELLLERGPDEITKEIVAAVKQQCGLSEDERKN